MSTTCSARSRRIGLHIGLYTLMLVLVPASMAIARAEVSRGAGLCTSGNAIVWDLDGASVDALLDYTTGGSIGTADIRFTQTPQLQMISVDDILRVPQVPLLPAGYAGPVEQVTLAGDEIIFRVRQDRVPGLTDPSLLGYTLEVTNAANDGAGPPTCVATGTGMDVDGDGVPESGHASFSPDDVCAATQTQKGNDQAFKMVLVEGVEINGVLSVGDFELGGGVDFDAEIVNPDKISNLVIGARTRIAFTGEISADIDYMFGGEPVFAGAVPVARIDFVVPGFATVSFTLVASAFVGTEGFIRAGSKAGFSATAATEMSLSWDQATNTPLITTAPIEFDLQISPPELNEDSASCFTLYGGASVALNAGINYGGLITLANGAVEMTARGLVNASIVPGLDPWWTIAGKSEVYVDVDTAMLFGDLTNYNTTIVDTDPVVFFSSQDEFPFASAPSAKAGGGAQTAGDALRWSRVYLDDAAIYFQAAKPTSDGGVIAVADDGPEGNGVLLKVDYQGKRQWQRRLDGDYLPKDVLQMADGGYAVLGLRPNGSLWIARFDASGDLVWSQEYLTAPVYLWGSVNGALVDSDTAIVIAGHATNGSDVAPYALKVLPDGSVAWIKTYGQTAVSENINGVSATADNAVILVGSTTYDVGDNIAANSYTLRLNADGTVRWSNVFATKNTDQLNDVVQLPDGGFVAVGISNGSPLDAGPRGLLVRYAADDAVAPVENLWHRHLGGYIENDDMYYDRLNSVAVTDGGYFVAGTSGLTEQSRTWIARVLESAGKPKQLWSIVHDGPDVDQVESVHDIGDGLLLAGSSASFGPGLPGDSETIWLSRLPYDGYMHWNPDSQATSQYAHQNTQIGPLYPAFIAAFNITASEDLTSLEEEAVISVTSTLSTQLMINPDGFLPKELVRTPLPFVDLDTDGVADDIDNCLGVFNALQQDSNGDGYGNACDADLNNDNVVNFPDVAIFAGVFTTSDADADLNSDGVVNFLDLSILSGYFLQAPGPSAIAP